MPSKDDEDDRQNILETSSQEQDLELSETAQCKNKVTTNALQKNQDLIEMQTVPEVNHVEEDLSKLPRSRSLTLKLIFISWKKEKFVIKEELKNICKALFYGENTERAIVDILKKHHPDDLVTGAAAIIQKECKLSRKNLRSILQDKTHNGVITFTWDK
ncbi:unnamed protein product [Mytilus coruscus]|uniref:Uncharacterized protein n=1 Tax=Mytilus coruscus TaxID=42192 RepID=A0A6J8C4T1_MYTCO|nr:unnamed protein product [Mytilus coruscus]